MHSPIRDDEKKWRDRGQQVLEEAGDVERALIALGMTDAGSAIHSLRERYVEMYVELFDRSGRPTRPNPSKP